MKTLEFLLNAGRWAFDMEPRYTIALLSAQRKTATEVATFHVSGPSANLSDFLMSVQLEGVEIRVSSLGEDKAVPLVPTQEHANVLAQLRKGVPFGELQDPTNTRSAVAKESIHALPGITHIKLPGPK